MTNKEIEKLQRKWRRLGGMEKRLYKMSQNEFSRARSYGAWLAYQQCALDIGKLKAPVS